MKIFKEKLEHTLDGQVQTITMSSKAKVLSCGLQNNTIVVWFLTDENAEEDYSVGFRIYGTGFEIKNPDELSFIGTIDNKGFIFHVFQVVMLELV